MKICQACNIKYEDDKKFCRQCGGALEPDVASSPEVMVKRQGFEKRIEDNPLDVERLLAYGEYLASTALHNEALVQFLKAQELDPNHARVLRGLATSYQALRKYEKAAEYLARTSELVPKDRDILTRRLEVSRKLTDITERNTEIVEICQSLHAIQPFANPACSLVLGIHYEIASRSFGGETGLDDSEKLLAHALTNATYLNARELACGMLHWCGARLHRRQDEPSLVDLANIERGQLKAEELPLLASCLLILGKTCIDHKMLNEAVDCFNYSLTITDTQTAHEQLARAYGLQGDLLAERGKGGAARNKYVDAQKHCSGNSVLQSKINVIKANQAKTNGIRAAIASLVIALTALFYYGHGSLLVRTDISANVTLLKGGAPIATSESGYLRTSLLLYRPYMIKITKLGYATIEQAVTPAFGRGTKEIDKFTLSPLYGTIKATSDPPGAKIVVKNQYEEKNCTTPCEVTKLFAMPSEVEVQLSGYETYKSKLDIPADTVHDLGTVVFKGDLKVDSNPPDAEVLINGKVQGKTPFSMKELPAKKTTLEIRKKGEGLYVASVPISPGKETDLGVVTLSKLAAIRVDSTPQGAVVQLDGKRQEGKTPLVLNGLALGKHEISLKNDSGVSTLSKELNLAAGEVVDLGTISLFGSIKVGSQPTGATVYINGEKKGVTPLTETEVVLAKWTTEIEITKDDLSFKKVFTLRPGESEDLGIIKLYPRTSFQKYVGTYHFEGKFFDSDPMRSRLYKILGSNFELFKRNMSVSGPFTMDNDNILFVSGNAPHAGGSDFAAFALDTIADEIFIILVQNGSHVRLFREKNSNVLPNDLNKWAVESHVNIDQATNNGSRLITAPSQPVPVTGNIVAIPNHVVGDTYITEVVNSINEKNNFKTERRVVSVAPSKIVVESKSLSSKKGTVRVLEYTPEWNIIRSRNPDGEGSDFSPPLKYFEFPLSPGKRWQQTSVETNSKTGAKRNHTLSATVGDWDMVTTPAGTFKAIKVIINTELLDIATGQKTSGSDTSWYVPELRRSVKSETWSMKPDGSKEDQIIHLLNYNIEK